MMNYPAGGWGFSGLFGFVNEIVWLIVGILLIMWLWEKVKRK